MTTKKNRNSVPWGEVRQELLTNTADALAYLAITAEDEPETMLDSLVRVLQARPDLAQVVISPYMRHLRPDELMLLKKRCPAAGRYIEKNREALLLLAEGASLATA